jgi:redox-sensitive bicupin YhaK (pirin superfamily)
LIASPDGSGNAVKIHADAKVYAGLFNGSQSQKLDLDPGRKAYAHLVKGSLQINGIPLSGGDALLIENESDLLISGGNDAEVIIFDLSH